MLNIKKLVENAKIPTRAHNTDAGLDLYAAEDIFILKGETKVIKTGIAIQIPEGMVGKIEDRSSMAVKGLKTSGGVIDFSYSAEIGVIINNLTCELDRLDFDDISYKGYRIKAGDKIAQMLIYRIETYMPTEVYEIWSGDRAQKGFGSSGI